MSRRTYRQPRGGNGCPSNLQPPQAVQSHLAEQKACEQKLGLEDSEDTDMSQREPSASQPDFENSEDYDMFGELAHENDQFPPQQALVNALRQLPNDSPNKLAYQALQKHEEWNTKYEHVDWRPFANELAWMLFAGHVDPGLHVTRNILKWVLSMLHTLQTNGIIKQDYWIPRNATTIEQWKRFFPKPPTRYVCVLSTGT